MTAGACALMTAGACALMTAGAARSFTPAAAARSLDRRRLDVGEHRLHLRIRPSLLRRLQQPPHHVAGPQQHADQRRRRRHLALADLVEQVFEAMREAGRLLQAEHPAAALDGVRRAENAVERFRVRRAAGLEAQQAALHRFEMFPGLFEKDLAEPLQVLVHDGRCRARLRP